MKLELLTLEDLENAIQKAFIANTKNMRIEAAKILFPKWLKTDEAARLLDVEPQTILKRKDAGKYIEGEDFKRDGVKLFLWSRDRLIQELKETP